MTLEHIPIDNVTEADLRTLVTARVAEGKRIEYKRQVELGPDSDRKKFLEGVTSFANSEGGELLVGVEAVAGIPQGISGAAIPNPDDTIRLMEDLIRQGVAPRIPQLQIRAIPLSNGENCLLVRIGRSWLAPHMVTFNDSMKFHARTSAGKHLMDVQELRDAFGRAGATRDRLARFRDTRLEAIRTGKSAPGPLSESALMVVHLLPVSAFETPSSVELLGLETNLSKLRTLFLEQTGYRWNVDGIVSYSSTARDSKNAYTQFYRDGRIEAVAPITYKVRRGPSVIVPQEDTFLRTKIGVELAKGIGAWLQILEGLELAPPFVLFVSLLGVRGARVQFPAEIHNASLPVDRDDLVLPEAWLSTIRPDLNPVVKDLVERVGNAAGLADWNPSTTT